MATRISPIRRSNAITTRSPTRRCMRSASSSTTAHTAMVTHRAATHSIFRSGAWATSSITVAMAEGPASAGMAKGTISGSPGRSVGGPASGGKIMRSAIRKSTTAPAICSDRSLRFITRRNCAPKNKNTSSSANAISTSRRITRARRSGATPRSALAKMGMLPSGSVISSSKMVADAKV